MTTSNSASAIICIAVVAQDMCGNCLRPLIGQTGLSINHLYARDPERATCGAAPQKFLPSPRLCMISEEDHHDRIPELAEALGRADWSRIRFATNPIHTNQEGLLILARAAATVLTVEPHLFIPGRLCPDCRGYRLVDERVGWMPGLRDGTRMPLVSGRKLLCSTCSGKGALPLEPAQ